MFAAYVIDGGGSNKGCFTISTPALLNWIFWISLRCQSRVIGHPQELSTKEKSF